MEKIENNVVTDEEPLKKEEKIINSEPMKTDNLETEIKEKRDSDKNITEEKDINIIENNTEKNKSEKINLNSKNSTNSKIKTTEKISETEKNTNTNVESIDSNIPKQQKKSNSRNKKIIIAITIILLLLIILALSTVFGIITSSSNKVISGISINGIDISNLTKDEAILKLKTSLESSLNREITLTHDSYSTKLATSEISPSYNIEESVNLAYNIGRSGSNIFSNNAQVIKTRLNKQNITLTVYYNTNLLDEKIVTINEELPDKVVNSSYKVENNNLIIANSTNGYRIQNETFKANMQSALENNKSSIELPVEEYQADGVDIDAIYAEVHKNPVDATFTLSPYEIKKEEDGLDFAISLDEAKKIVSQNQESYTIPLKVVKPKITVKSLPQEAFPDQLATYSTTYAASNYNRSTNISLAAKAVNGCVLMPGETFSYNDTLGQRTTAKGYKEAGAYVNGQVTTDVGGGICQVSSTLYNAVLLCNLEIVDRKNHTFESSYVPVGQDATVSWKSPDFKFKNNREYPIKISATAGGGRVTFIIYGVKSENDYEVKIQSSKTETIPFTTQYVDDPSLPVGTTNVTQAGSNGCKSQTYKILYKNGKEISRTLINSDTYKPHNKVVVRGTKAVSQPTPSPSTAEPETSVQPNTAQSSETVIQQNQDDSITITTDEQM